MTPEDRALVIASNWEIYGVAQQRLADQIAEAIHDAVEEALVKDATEIHKDEEESLANYRKMLEEVRMEICCVEVEAEREACAKVAEEHECKPIPPGLMTIKCYCPDGIAQAIRSRK